MFGVSNAAHQPPPFHNPSRSFSFPPCLGMHVLWCVRPQEAVPARWGRGPGGGGGVSTPETHQGAHSGWESALAGAAGAPLLILQMAFTAASRADLSAAAPARPVSPLCASVASTVSSREELLHAGGPDRGHSPCVTRRGSARRTILTLGSPPSHPFSVLIQLPLRSSLYLEAAPSLEK